MGQELLDGRFRIGSVIGKGNMGEVHRAEDLHAPEGTPGRTVAVKTVLRRRTGIRIDTGADPKAAERFAREVRIMRVPADVGWHTLAAAASLKPADLSDNAREAVLVAVDSPTSPHGVLLSSLVVSAEHTPVPYFDSILKRLGRPHGLRPIQLGQARKREQSLAFAAYSPASITASRERT